MPGHGYPVFGAIRVRQVLNDTANYLQSFYDQTIAMMNAGAPLDEVIHTVKPPANLAEKPWLQAVYDEPEFIVRNIWRLEGGWYDGTPSNLKPATEAERAARSRRSRVASAPVIARANEKLAAGEVVLACHLADWAVAAAPDDKSAHEARMRDLRGARRSRGIDDGAWDLSLRGNRVGGQGGRRRRRRISGARNCITGMPMPESRTASRYADRRSTAAWQIIS